jgi:hypothetical protein
VSKRLDVLTAVKALVASALPGADLRGLANDAERPKRIPPDGLVIIRDGDPGEPNIDLSPPAYHYAHLIPIELASCQSAGDLRAIIDTMAAAIGAAVLADRTLGGLCDFLDVEALSIVDLIVAGGATQLGGQFNIIAQYSAPSPLG